MCLAGGHHVTETVRARCFPGCSVVKQPPASAGEASRDGPLEEEVAPTPGFLPGRSHGQRSLAGYSPWGHKRVRRNLVTKQQELPPDNQGDRGLACCRGQRASLTDQL